MEAGKVFKKGKVSAAPSSGGARYLKLEDGKPVDVVLLASTADMVSFNQHAFWRDEGNSPIFPCIVDACPGCEAGDKAKFKAVLPVLVLGGDGSKEPVLWIFGITVARSLQDMEEASGELKGQSIRIKRTGTGLKTRYGVVTLSKKYNITKIKVDWDEIIKQLGPTDRTAILALMGGSVEEEEAAVPEDEGPLEEVVSDDELEEALA